MARISHRGHLGVVYITPGLLLFLIIALLIVAGMSYISNTQSKVSEQEITVAQAPVQVQVSSQGDDRFNRAPKPERDWLVRPDLSVLANSPTAIISTIPTIATQGIPESYQSMGVLKTDSGQMLPLYGRRTSSRSDRFQYYTRTDSFNPVQLPLEYRRHNCQDDVGCDELYDGEKLKIGATGESAVATIYRFSGPTYVPAII